LPVKARINSVGTIARKKGIVAIAAIVLFAAGCGDGGGDESAGSGGGSGGGVSLTITGSPPSQILVGSPFSFTPTVNNPDSVSLTFSATNLPAWASINASTGRVTGTPGAGDVGTSSGIRITVSGGGTSDTSPAFSVEVVAAASGSATLTWQPPTQNADGSPLTNLVGYSVYWGLTPSDLSNSTRINNAGITSYLVEQLTPATWYFAITARDADGDESDFSNIASKTVM